MVYSVSVAIRGIENVFVIHRLCGYAYELFFRNVSAGA